MYWKLTRSETFSYTVAFSTSQHRQTKDVIWSTELWFYAITFMLSYTFTTYIGWNTESCWSVKWGEGSLAEDWGRISNPRLNPGLAEHRGSPSPLCREHWENEIYFHTTLIKIYTVPWKTGDNVSILRRPDKVGDRSEKGMTVSILSYW